MKLTEAQLKQVISETTKRVLREYYDDDDDLGFESEAALDELSEGVDDALRGINTIKYNLKICRPGNEQAMQMAEQAARLLLDMWKLVKEPNQTNDQEIDTAEQKKWLDRYFANERETYKTKTPSWYKHI